MITKNVTLPGVRKKPWKSGNGGWIGSINGRVQHQASYLRDCWLIETKAEIFAASFDAWEPDDLLIDTIAADFVAFFWAPDDDLWPPPERAPELEEPDFPLLPPFPICQINRPINWTFSRPYYGTRSTLQQSLRKNSIYHLDANQLLFIMQKFYDVTEEIQGEWQDKVWNGDREALEWK